MENKVSVPTGGVSDLIGSFDSSSQAPAHSMGGKNSDISSSNANLQLELEKTDNNKITDQEVDFILEELVKLRDRVQLGNSAAFGSFLAACRHFQTHLQESRQCELRELKQRSHEEDNEEICQPTSEDIEKEETKTWSRSSVSKSHDETSKFVIFHHSDITDALSKSVETGKGGCGSVYKCELFGNIVAIKKSHPENKSGEEEFLQEVEVLHGMHHRNLVKLLGACFYDRALVYEYLPNGSVDDHLKKQPSVLSWKIRTGIIVETCLALKFLHSKSVVHGDLKPANILLDANFNSKLCDFGFSRFLPEGIGMQVYLQTSPRGSLAYVDPKFFETGILRPGSDLHSFGVTILTLLTGRLSPGLKRNMRDANESSFRYMIDYTAGSWPFELAKELRCWALKCCYHNDNSSELMGEMSLGLEDMLEEIASAMTTTLSSSVTGTGGSKAGLTSSNSTTELDEGQYNNIQITDNEEAEAQTSSNGTSSEDELIESGIGTHASSFSDTSSAITLFSHSEILAATDGLSESSKIGQGGYGSFYKGSLCGTTVAIKVLDSIGNQDKEEFFRVMEAFHKLRHPNVVKLVGVCLEDHHALVYEFVSNGNLECCFERMFHHLFTWQIRIHIIHGICSALIYLHSKSMVHGDLKPANILLDNDLNIKLADFGLHHLLSKDAHNEASMPMGTWGYVDPLFLETGIIGTGCDVYSFGVIVLQILTGMPPSGLVRQFHSLFEGNNMLLEDMLAPAAGEWPDEIAQGLAQWGFICCVGNKDQNILEDMLASLDDVLAKID